MMEPAGPGVPTPRAFLRVGGATLARHQLGLALAMECQRIVCISRQVGPEIIALQHDAENAGAQFHVIAQARKLAGLVTANDELLVISEGLLVAQRDALQLLEGSHAVLVLPADTGTGAGFERIDLNHASAGLMRIPGRFVERLYELPGDCDVPSALTRIALQAGVAMREVPLASREGAKWCVVRDEAEAHAIERDWIRLHIAHARGTSPAAVIARLGVMTFGPSLLHSQSGTKLIGRASVVLLLFALGAGWLELIVTGFVLCAIATILGQAASMLRSVERNALNLPVPALSSGAIFGWALDCTLILLVFWSIPLTPWETIMPWGTVPERAFAPIVLLLMRRLVVRLHDGNWVGWVRDRTLLCVALAIAASMGMAHEVVQILAIVIALAGLLVPDRN